MSFTAFAQELRVTGTVTSAEDGEPLIGVSVIDTQSTRNAVTTDLDGVYTITVAKGSTISFSYVGCEKVEKKINESGNLDIVLHSANVLDEVVVVGYGTMKKSDLTGSVTTVASFAGQRPSGPGSRRNGKLAVGTSGRTGRGTHPRRRDSQRRGSYICG